MENNLQLFNFENQQVRTLKINGEPWFVGKDVANILGYTHGARDINAHEALFADSVATSKSTVLVGELAKILRGNGVDIGATRLFRWMREHGYLISRKGSDWNMPTQKAMNLGLFKIKETTINHSNGTTSISKTPKVTGKGQQYFINKFLKERELVNE